VTLAALVQLNGQSETMGEFIAGMTLKYAPIPDHLQQSVNVLDAAWAGDVFAPVSEPLRIGKTDTLANGVGAPQRLRPGIRNFCSTCGSKLAIQTSHPDRYPGRERSVTSTRRVPDRSYRG
jgi:hypothetical protein